MEAVIYLFLHLCSKFSHPNNLWQPSGNMQRSSLLRKYASGMLRQNRLILYICLEKNLFCNSTSVQLSLKSNLSLDNHENLKKTIWEQKLIGHDRNVVGKKCFESCWFPFLRNALLPSRLSASRHRSSKTSCDHLGASFPQLGQIIRANEIQVNKNTFQKQGMTFCCLMSFICFIRTYKFCDLRREISVYLIFWHNLRSKWGYF